ncbi:class I SAM-dependent methyltransferase [Pinirhizobacter sp.]|jgi:SAM-dependent methyltransferase|uniref:class I SAM-dependent methyltransferase n=1 Tax=Pinirhizobacter sp. TaxID=2950432 RepID=UPI002F3F5B22
MQQTPVHEQHNPDLLKFMPTNARRVVEVGCSSGALARAYKAINPDVHYIGTEIDPTYAELARRHCDEVLDINVEQADAQTLGTTLGGDCWVFGDVLEHLHDPWKLLANIRAVLPPGGTVVACIPNAQHWSVQAKLSFGNFRYEDSGLFDRTHIRWFTRMTMIEMFQGAGFAVEDGMARIFDDPQRHVFLPIIKAMAAAAQADPEMAAQDALALQYVLRGKAA